MATTSTWVGALIFVLLVGAVALYFADKEKRAKGK